MGGSSSAETRTFLPVAVLLACCSAALFGAMTVALRVALRRSPDAELGAVVTVGVATVVALVAAAAEPASRSARPRDLAFFALAGLIAPGASQLFYTLAIRDAGASRTSVVVGGAPLVAVAIAIALLGEPVQLGLVVGALLIVLGGLTLVGERIRPTGFRARGLAFAAATALLFSTRDNLVRWYSGDARASSAAGAATALVAGTVAIGVFALLSRRRRPRQPPAGLAAFVPAGLLFGLSYVSLFEAYFRGRVSVVSPLVATESLWGVLLAALVLRRSELVGTRLIAGAALIVAGGALIGVVR
jgi:drug/metabolite transporter (DMT)-like permease